MVDLEIAIYESSEMKWQEESDLFAFVLNEDRIQLVKLTNKRFNFNHIPEIYEYEDDILIKIARDFIENQLIQL
jgi:hypothetical protein